MGLELKHIAPYLPYKLNWDLSTTEYGEEEVNRLKECKLISLGNPPMTGMTLQTNIRSQNNGIMHLDIGAGKPILHPLSDLAKEIEHNGEKFIPMEVINKQNSFGEYLYIQDGKDSRNYMGLDWWTEEEGGFEFWEMQVVYEKLFEWHFDVFGLIEANLALNFNEIN